MASFTALSAWDSLQDRTAANEIVLAYSERRQCVGDSAISALASGGNAQDTAFWKGMQDWCESKCTSFVNDGVSIAGESSITMHTLSTWRTEAGIADGFRRATTWPTDWTNYADAAYSYGPIQAGDIRGPWIFEDLQKAFDALRWTHKTKTPELSSTAGKKQSTGDDEDEAVAKQDAIAAFPSGWTEVSASTIYEATVSIDRYAPKIVAGIDRRRNDVVFTSIPDHIAHTASGYYHNGEFFHDSDGFIDFDAIGWGYEELALIESFTTATTDTRTIASLSYDDVLYFPATPGTIDGDFESWGCWADYAALILKWQFSNTL